MPCILGAVRTAVARPPPSEGARAMRLTARMSMRSSWVALSARAATKRVARDEARVVVDEYSIF
eukprot:6177125-Pleurochrysis_carterae.AAC.1